VRQSDLEEALSIAIRCNFS